MKEFFPFKIKKLFSRILALLGILLVICGLTSVICCVIVMFSSVERLTVKNIGIMNSDFTIYLLIAIFATFMIACHEKK